MKKSKQIKTIKNPSLTTREEFFTDYVGHPGPASTIAAHQRRAQRLAGGTLMKKDAFTKTIGTISKKRKRK